MEVTQSWNDIRNALENYYFHGIYEGDVALLKNVMHHSTWLFGDIKGKPYARSLDEYLEIVANRVSPKMSGKPFEGKVLAIDVSNTIAVAHVQVKMYDFFYDERLSFHKLEGRWLIVSKMLTDISD